MPTLQKIVFAVSRYFYKYDAFLSHAYEDKIPFTNELYFKLQEAGLNIWYSGDKIREGAGSLQERIEDGMKNSRYGIIIFSPNFLKKNWTMAEFNYFWLRDGKGRNDTIAVLPVYYNVTIEEVRARVNMIEDRIGIKADQGVDYVAQQLVKFINKQTFKVVRTRFVTATAMAMLIGLIAVASIFLFSKTVSSRPDANDIEQLVRDRVRKVDGAEQSQTQTAFGGNRFTTSDSQIDSIFAAFWAIKSYYRNEYEFANGFEEIRSKKRVNEALQLDVEDLPAQNYGMEHSAITIERNEGQIIYEYVNQDSVVSTIEGVNELDPKRYSASVKHKNFIRSVRVTLVYPDGPKGTKRHHVEIKGLRPRETYVLEPNGDGWEISEIVERN